MGAMVPFSLPSRIQQLHKTVGFLEVPGLATNMLLGTVFISRYIEKITLKDGTTTS